MARKIKLTQNQIDALEVQTELAFQALKRVVETGEIIDATAASNMYKVVLKNSILLVTNGHMPLEMSTQQADLLNRYLLQYTFGSEASNQAITRIKQSGSPHQRNGLYENQIISKLRVKRQEYSNLVILASNTDIKTIIKVIVYVRDAYQKPEPTV